jgi:hypothetical protein
MISSLIIIVGDGKCGTTGKVILNMDHAPGAEIYINIVWDIGPYHLPPNLSLCTLNSPSLSILLTTPSPLPALLIFGGVNPGFLKLYHMRFGASWCILETIFLIVIEHFGKKK